MTGEVHTSTNHDVIRCWAKARGGRPAQVASRADQKSPGLLKIVFPQQEPDDNIELMRWDDFLKTFDEKRLQFVYQEKLHDGEMSRFNKFVYRNSD